MPGAAPDVAAGQPLPGLLLPTDNWDLTNRFIHRDAAYLFNKTVQGLVMHDPEIRMTTWNRLSALFDQVESLCAPTSENPLTGKDLGLTLSRLLDSNSTARLAKQKRDFYSAREDYSNRLATAISEALDENEGARALIQLSQQNDKIEFSLARRSDEAILKLAEFSLEDGELRDGQSWPGMRARLRIGADPIEDLLPTLTADVVWKDDFKRFKLSIVVYLCRFGTGSSGGMFVAVPPNPKYYHLEWTSIGDDAYLAQARIAATAAAHDFFDMLQALLTPGAA